MRRRPTEVICLLCEEGEQRVMTWAEWEWHLNRHSIQWAREDKEMSHALPGKVFRVGRVSEGRLRGNVCLLRLKLSRGDPRSPHTVWDQDAAQLLIPTLWDRIVVRLMEPFFRWSEWLYRERRKRQRAPWKLWIENSYTLSTSTTQPVPEQHDDPPTYRLPGTPVSDDRGEDGNSVIRE